jgi:hypothetical protein
VWSSYGKVGPAGAITFSWWLVISSTLDWGGISDLEKRCQKESKRCQKVSCPLENI